jgi:hypothetical protein
MNIKSIVLLPEIVSEISKISVYGGRISTIGNINSTGNGEISTGGKGSFGNIECSGTVKSNSFQSTSDYRIKSNVINLDHTYNVSKLNPVFYKNVLSWRY